MAYDYVGVSTMTFDKGTFRFLNARGCCPEDPLGSYTVDAGRITVPFPDGRVLFEANWTLDGDQLQFSDVTSETDTQEFVDAVWGGKPWTRIGDAPSVATTSPSVEDTAVPASVGEVEEFPDGVYRMEVTSDEMLALGATPEQAYRLPGPSR